MDAIKPVLAAYFPSAPKALEVTSTILKVVAVASLIFAIVKESIWLLAGSVITATLSFVATHTHTHPPSPPALGAENSVVTVGQQKAEAALAAVQEELAAVKEEWSKRWVELSQANRELQAENARLRAHVSCKINGISREDLAALLKSKVQSPQEEGPVEVSFPTEGSSIKSLTLLIEYNDALRCFVANLRGTLISSENQIYVPGTFSYCLTPSTSKERYLMNQSFIDSPKGALTTFDQSAFSKLKEATDLSQTVLPNYTDKEMDTMMASTSAAWIVASDVEYQIDFPKEYHIDSFSIQITHPPVNKLPPIKREFSDDIQSLMKRRPRKVGSELPS